MKHAVRTGSEFVDAVTYLFEGLLTLPLTIEDIETTLRDAGYDPEQVGADMRAVADQALAEAANKIAEDGGTDSGDWYPFSIPRCNGCKLAHCKSQLGDKFLLLPSGVYKLDAPPCEGQGEPTEHDGRPIRFVWWGMSYGHRDECRNWQPPEGEGVLGK